MLTADIIEAMSPNERLAELERLTGKLFVAPGIDAQLARAVGVHPKTYFGWKKHPQRIPAAVLLLMQEWDNQARGQQAQIVKRWEEVAEHLDALATSLAGLARLAAQRTPDDEFAQPQEPACQ